MRLSEAAVQSFILAKKADGRAERTIEDYHRCLDPFSEWCESRGLDADNLDRDDFRRYVAEELRSNDWAQNTVAIHIQNLRCLLSWLHDEGHTKENLAQAVEAPEREIRVEEPLTQDEIQAML